MITLGIALNTGNLAPSQYAGLNFNSLCVFNGEILGAGETGLFELTGEDDNGTDIVAFFQVPSTDLGIPKIKKVRSLITSGYTEGNLSITVIIDNDEETEYTIVAFGSMDTGSVKVDLNSDDEGRFVGLLVENINGADFSIDAMDLLVLPTLREPAAKSIVAKHRGNFPLFVSAGVADFGVAPVPEVVVTEVTLDETEMEALIAVSMNNGGSMSGSAVDIIVVNSATPQIVNLYPFTTTCKFKVAKLGVGKVTLKCPTGYTINDSSPGGTMYCESTEVAILDITYAGNNKFIAAGIDVWTTT
jgi:hypothetical protein